MSDERCSDLLCPVCSVRCELYDQEIQRRVQELMAMGAGMLPYKYKPPTLRQRIWAKFTTLAQWVRPERN